MPHITFGVEESRGDDFLVYLDSLAEIKDDVMVHHRSGDALGERVYYHLSDLNATLSVYYGAGVGDLRGRLTSRDPKNALDSLAKGSKVSLEVLGNLDKDQIYKF